MVFTRTQPQIGRPGVAVLFCREKGGNCLFPLSAGFECLNSFLPLFFSLRAIKNGEQEGGVLGTAHFSILPHFTEKKMLNFSNGWNFILALTLRCEHKHPPLRLQDQVLDLTPSCREGPSPSHQPLHSRDGVTQHLADLLSPCTTP